MNDLIKIGIWVVAIGVIFGLLWYKGYLKRLTDYVEGTREELRKCSWPTWEELKGSTIIVAISIGILGLYTFLVDRVLFGVFMWFKI